MLRTETPQNVLCDGRNDPEVHGRRAKMNKSREYGWGLVLFLFGGAGLAEHITSGRGSFPVCAVILGLGLALMAWSYIR